MQIDPQLQKLTELIEQKRIQQNLQSGSGVVGRPGNPKFADAALRVQMAREGKWSSGNLQSSQASISTNQSKTYGVSGSMSPSSLTRVAAREEDEQLTGLKTSGHLYSTDTPQIAAAASQPHLGRNFDRYA